MKTKPTTQHATEPTPAYAFSTFIKGRPALQEIAERTKIDTTDKTSPGLFFLKARLALERENPPPYTEDQHILMMSTTPLLARIKNEQMTRKEILELQKQILNIRDLAKAPQAEHQKIISALLTALDNAQRDFENWITLDPAGISAAAQDKTHGEWMDAERIRTQKAEERAERQRQAESRRKQFKREAEALKSEIGDSLTSIDPNHPDIDHAAIREFLDWHASVWRVDPSAPRNVMLQGFPGVGKSRALAAAAIALCESDGRDGIEWVTGWMFSDLVAALANDKRGQASKSLKALAEAPVLFFDDLGSVDFTKARTSRFFSLIDARYRSARPTLVSTNCSTPELKKILTEKTESKDDAVRILRRLIGTTSTPLAKFFHFRRPQK
jgi:DNA replication protein DnaC